MITGPVIGLDFVPRSLGSRGSFVSSPFSKLPPSLYTRDRSQDQPLLPLPPSPQLEMSIQLTNPGLLRTMKRRSIASRTFGPGANTGRLKAFHGGGSGR